MLSLNANSMSRLQTCAIHGSTLVLAPVAGRIDCLQALPATMLGHVSSRNDVLYRRPDDRAEG